jgi:hypothetical protein
MANLNLICGTTNNTTTMTVADSSTYPTNPPNVSAQLLR